LGMEGNEGEPAPSCGPLHEDFAWERLAPGSLNELKNRMPKDEKGRNKGRYPQLLTDDVGHPALAQHLHAVTTLMTASRSWGDFKRMINIALPKKGTNLEFDFGPVGEASPDSAARADPEISIATVKYKRSNFEQIAAAIGVDVEDIAKHEKSI
jgi:hypothetical protein